MRRVELNTGPINQAIRRAIGELEDMTPIFRDVRDYMIDVTKKRFIHGKAPDGTTWVPKSSATIERYKRMGYGNLPKTLVGRYGRLSQGISGRSDATRAVIGSSMIYSRVMQEGAAKGAFGTAISGKRMVPIPWGRIPARTWLGISKTDETAIIDIVDEALERTIGK